MAEKSIKRKVVFCKVYPYFQDEFKAHSEMFMTYAFDYLIAFAETRESIRDNYEFSILPVEKNILDEDLIYEVSDENPYMVGFSCSLLNTERCMNIARQIKLGMPEVRIVAGGAETFAAKRFLEKYPFVDFAVMGEGEAAFAELLEVLYEEGDTRGIEGLAFRDGEEIVLTGKRNPIEKLDDIPQVITSERVASLSGIVPYETGRGCSNGCAYCLWSPYPKRYFSMDRIKRELDVLMSNERIGKIWFINSEFDDDRNRSKEILRYVRDRRKHDIRLAAYLNFDSIDEEMLELVGELFFWLPIGLQTTDTDTLKSLGRGWFDLAKFEKTFDLIMENIPGSIINIDLMYGLPGENYESFIKTLLWCIRKRTPEINFFRLAVYPQTVLERKSNKYGFVYDKEPPYLVYASDTFSYDDMLKIEQAIINYLVLMSLYGPEGLERIHDNCDMKELLGRLQECSANYAGNFEHTMESNIKNINNNELRKPVMEFIRRRMKDEKAAGELERFIRT
ncbi:MAG TPA: radical SAM protein [bacterium]|nr:radical SAM protein [bacterium]